MKVLIASGGTGGHLYPAMALAQELGKRNCSVLLAIKANVSASKAIPVRGLNIVQLHSAPFNRKNPFKNITGLFQHVSGTWEAIKVLKDFQPGCTVGFGGYASFPAVLASWLRGIPVIIHEQNVLPGLANRLASRLARNVAVCFPEAFRSFPGKAVLTGNPMREELFHLDKNLSIQTFGLRPERTTVLIFGGSAGARGINQAIFEGLVKAADLKGKIQFIHLTGSPGETDKLRKRYRDLGFQAFVADYSQEMHLCYGAADLVISRSGASTVSELIATQRPSILIPYPHATGNHQRHNAEVLRSRGCALILEEAPLFAENLFQWLRDLAESPEKLQKMKQGFKQFPDSIGDAAKKLSELVLAQNEK